MLSFLVGVIGIVAELAIFVGLAFVLGITAPKVPNKAYRFVLLFVLGVPLNFVINYVNVWAFGYHKMSLTGAIIIALLLSVYGTFLPPRPHSSNTR